MMGVYLYRLFGQAFHRASHARDKQKPSPLFLAIFIRS